jgi:hypothetical protein
MILVVLAGGRAELASFAQSTAPLSASIKIADEDWMGRESAGIPCMEDTPRAMDAKTEIDIIA